MGHCGSPGIYRRRLCGLRASGTARAQRQEPAAPFGTTVRRNGPQCQTFTPQNREQTRLARLWRAWHCLTFDRNPTAYRAASRTCWTVSSYRTIVRLQMVWDNLSCLGTEALARLGLRLGGFQLMFQSSLSDGVAFDPFSFQKDGSASAEVDVGRCQVL